VRAGAAARTTSARRSTSARSGAPRGSSAGARRISPRAATVSHRQLGMDARHR
jgi:hypothetical protein